MNESTSFYFLFQGKNKVLLSGWSDFFRYIEKGDLLRFLEEEEVHTIFPLFEGAMETGKINKSAFKNWMVSFTDTPLSFHCGKLTKRALMRIHKSTKHV